MILRPVLVYGAGSDGESLVEDLCIRACIHGFIASEDTAESLARDGFNLDTLKRRFREALDGAEFPVKSYEARRVTVRFRVDDDEDGDGELTWEEMEDQ